MKIFISWSGDTARDVAQALAGWLPNVLQHVQPWISPEIEKGARWSAAIDTELGGTDNGIVVVTKGNQLAPWLNFEAGALAKNTKEARVRTLLFETGPTDLRSGPLTIFQHTIARDRDDMKKLVESINTASDADRRLDPLRLSELFDILWPRLEESFSAIAAAAAGGEESEAPVSDREMLEEALLHLRSMRQQRPLDRAPIETLPHSLDDMTSVPLQDHIYFGHPELGTGHLVGVVNGDLVLEIGDERHAVSPDTRGLRFLGGIPF